MKKKVWTFSIFSTADASLASSHWLRPDLDAPGYCLFSDDLILIVLKGFDPFLSDCLSINHSNLSIHIRNNLDLH